MRKLALIVLCLAAGSLASGCNSGKRIAAANDQLRLERETQRERIDTLEAENAELQTKLAESNARLESPLPDDVLDALPRVASIELTRFCDVSDGEVTWSLSTKDGRGRFVQVVGTLELRAVSTGAEPAVLAEAVLTPAQVRDSYASGLAGTGYRVMRPIAGEASGPVTLTATLHDHVTGQSHEASHVVETR
ncbi:MAG: hypothetical protein AAFR96_10290 [Planctomycetota bacterium]